MIKTIEMYTIICDNCGKDSACDEYAAWNNKDYAEDIANDADFAKLDDKHYCPKCYSYDDDDNLILKTLT